MVQVDIDNTPISEQLIGGESVTVPDGEKWDVTISIVDVSEFGPILKINGVTVIYADKTRNTVHREADFVLAAGDTVSLTAESANISGYEVSA